jgi:hypothetical protein
VRAADGSGELPLPAYECHEDGGLPQGLGKVAYSGSDLRGSGC